MSSDQSNYRCMATITTDSVRNIAALPIIIIWINGHFIRAKFLNVNLNGIRNLAASVPSSDNFMNVGKEIT